MNYFVTAIGTDSGKTVISAILVDYLQSDYWKPIQCGAPRDTETVMALTNADASQFYNERHFLKMPASPHAAAKAEGTQVRLVDFHPPTSNRALVIEGAGGMLVPINDEEYVIDLAAQFESKVIVVCNLYLGSINHSLLTISEVQRRKLDVLGIIFNGPSNPESEDIILKKSPWPCLLRVSQEQEMTASLVSKYAQQLRADWGKDFEKIQDQPMLSI